MRGRLDAVLVAARIAPTTSGIGLIPVATTTHTEPFHVSKAIATLDWVSLGRAGVQVRVSSTALEARQFGRRVISDPSPADRRPSGTTAQVAELFEEAADFVEVLRRLWDSWEDDAEIRDISSGRFVDREKLHYIDFEGRWFSVKGPSITPRPPQGQPLVAALAHVPAAYKLAARSCDLVFVTPQSAPEARDILSEIRATEEAEGRQGPPLRVFADVVVFVDSQTATASARKAHLDELYGEPFRSDATVFVGTPADLADLLVEWQATGIDGFRLRPGVLPHDLMAITREVVGVLQERGNFRHRYEEGICGASFGLPRPENRYVKA